MAAALVPVLLGTLGGPTARPDGPPVPAPGYHHLGVTTQSLPISERATIEEYVEVYVDPAHGGEIQVPPVEVDNVQLKPDPGGRFGYWTDAVGTSPGADADGYCVTFDTPYDTWHAGSC